MKRETASAIAIMMLIASMFFSATSYVKGQTEAPDLQAGLSSTAIGGMYNHMLNGSSTVLNVTVTNIGNISASNVALELLINGNESLYAVTPTLGVNSTFWTAYFWSPVNGDYNLTVYAPPVDGETDYSNNNVTYWVRVCPKGAYGNPTPSFTATWSPTTLAPGPVQSISTVTFDASNSSDPNWDNITSYTWNFGDGTPNGTARVINHTYYAWGNMTVTLTVQDSENLGNTTSQNITVYAQPVANFTIVPPLPGPYFVNENLTFDASPSFDPDNMTAPNNGIAIYYWDFGDGTNATNSNVTHAYSNPGTYIVLLRVCDYAGVYNQFYVPVSVKSTNPVAIFALPPQPCYVGRALTFDASASYDPVNETGPNNGIAIYYWDFNDGNTTTVPYPMITHTYQSPGSYNVNLTVTDSEGLTGSTNNTITVSFEVFVRVVDASTNLTTINTYNPGQTFTVNITVTNVQNLYSYYFKLSWPATWMPPTWPDLFDPNSVTVNYPSDGFLGPAQYSNGTSRITWNPSAYPYDGYVIVNATLKENKPCSGSGTLATITFKVLTSGNCTLALSDILLSESFQSITPINNTAQNGTFYTSFPVAEFTPSNLDPAINQTITLDASQSYDPNGGNITSYEWDFGDTNVTSTSYPTIPHSYDSTGPKNINLTVTDNNGDQWWFNYTVNVLASADVGIIQVTPSIYQFNATSGLYETAGRLNITVTVTNEGSRSETFNVTVYFNDIFMENETVSNLAPGQNRTIAFTNCTIDKNIKVPEGVYNISAYAWPVPGQTDFSDNNCTGGAVRVFLEGDINRDGAVNILDATILSNALGSTPGSQNWNPNADLNGDGEVNILDAIILSNDFGD